MAIREYKFGLGKNSYESAVFYMILSGLAISLIALFGKVGLSEISFPLLLFLRFFLPFIILFIVLIPYKTFHKINKIHNLPSQFMRAIFEVICQYCFFFYLLNGSLLNATMFWSSAPLYMPVLAQKIFGHRIDRMTWFGIWVGLVGVICVLKPDSAVFDPVSIIGLMSGLASAVSQILNGVNRQRHSNDENMLYFFSLTSLVSFVPFALHFSFGETNLERGLAILQLKELDAWIPLVAIALATLIAQLFRGLAFSSIKPVMLGPFFYMPVLFSGLFGYWVYDQVPDFLAIIGLTLILISSFLRKKTR